MFSKTALEGDGGISYLRYSLLRRTQAPETEGLRYDVDDVDDVDDGAEGPTRRCSVTLPFRWGCLALHEKRRSGLIVLLPGQPVRSLLHSSLEAS